MKFTIALLAGISNALLTRNQTTKFGKTEAQLVNEIKSRLVGAEENPQEMWFNATIDHFDNHGAGSATYPMRYLYDTTYFDREKGPIIFYAGNEGDVWTFWDASGFMHTTLAQQFGALVVFGEHRYYGESMPFGDQTFDRKNLNMLTVEQAMADYVELIKMIKQTEGLEDRAVIVGGGSYGGMLAAWLRMKYPQWFQGALAASAPILFFDGYVDPYAYDDIATGVYAKADPECPISIKNGWNKLFEIQDDSSYYAQIQEIFDLCDTPTSAVDIQILSGYLNYAFGTMVMVDYPYPTDFVAPLPAWPINYACQQAADAAEAHKDDPLVDLWAMSAAGMVYGNYAHQHECIDLHPNNSESNSGLDGNGWGVQACNEMAMPFASRESTSMFPASEWNEKTNSAYCKTRYGENPQYSWALDYFGGYNPAKDFMKSSNIIFSNGELDPWHAGGVLTNVSEATTTIYIENSAHHLDLRLPNEADPASITAARQLETETIAKWIDQYQGTDFYLQVTTKQFLQ